jgi:PDZ domain-containing protein
VKAVLLVSALASSSIAATLNAQVIPAKPDSMCTTHPDGRVECRIERRSAGGDSLRRKISYRMDSAMAKRAALGLELRATGTRRDTLGVFVEAVTPKGPAETAGIIEGDRIAAINGVDLRTTAADVEDSYTNGLAAHRLTREVQKLTPGNRVTLRVYSAGRFRDVQVTAGKASEVLRSGGRISLRFPGSGGMMQFRGPGGAIFGPDTRIFREEIEPLFRERMNALPNRIQLRSPMRYKTLAPSRERRTFKADAGDVYIDAEDQADYEDAEDAFMLEMADDPFQFETEIEPVSAETIRELAARAARDAQSALKRLAVEQVS